MKIGTIVIALVLVGAVIYFISSSTISGFFNSQLVDGQTISVTGSLVMLSNPPMSQIVLPVEVWGVRETVYGVPTTRVFYLSHSSSPIMELSGYTVGEVVKVTGILHIRSDVNLNKVYLIEYADLRATG